MNGESSFAAISHYRIGLRYLAGEAISVPMGTETTEEERGSRRYRISAAVTITGVGLELGGITKIRLLEDFPTYDQLHAEYCFVRNFVI